MSGLSRTPGKRVWVYPHRGFESRLLRQELRNHAAPGLLFLFWPLFTRPLPDPEHRWVGFDGVLLYPAPTARMAGPCPEAVTGVTHTLF